MIKALLLVAALVAPVAASAQGAPAAPPAKDRWIGVDKVKHFMVSAFVQSAAFSAARATKLSHSNAHAVAGVTTAVIGVGREVHDKRVGRPFGVKDLVWDAAGAATAAALLNKTR